MRSLGRFPKSLPFGGFSQVALVVKNPHASAGDVKRHGFDPWVRRSSGGGHSNPLQYSCLEKTMDRGPWLQSIATVHSIAEQQLSMHRGLPR